MAKEYVIGNVKGPQGEQGEIGPQGPQGQVGITGPQGIQGVQGNAATIQVGTTTTGSEGTAAQVSNSGTATAAVFNFTIPKGERGIQGLQGIAGPVGPVGSQGIQGAVGPAGPKGDKGDTAPVNMANNLTTTTTGYALDAAQGKVLNDSLSVHGNDAVKHIAAAERTTWNAKAGTAVATTAVNGLMAAADKAKLDGVAAQANKTVIVNNLTTTAVGSALDAVQGKALNDRVVKQERVLTATLTAAGWSAAAPYTQAVNVAGVTATDVPVVSVVLSGTVDNKKAQQTAWNMVSEIDTGAGKITATCNESKPTVNFVIQMKGV